MSRVILSGIAGRAIRAQIARQKAREREVIRVQRATERVAKLTDRRARLDAKEAAKAYAASRIEEAEEINKEIAAKEAEIGSILPRSLDQDPTLPILALRRMYAPKPFKGLSPGIEPEWQGIRPPPLGFFERLIPGATTRYENRVKDARSSFEKQRASYLAKLNEIEIAKERHAANEREEGEEITRYNENIDGIEAGLKANDRSAFVDYYGALISKSLVSEIDAVAAEVGYAPESRHLVVDLELPSIEVIPECASYRYVKTSDHIEPQIRPASKRSALYANLINQVVLKCVDTVFRGAVCEIGCLTVNAMLDAIDPATRQQIRPCLLSVRVTANDFANLNLRHVQPDQCLKALKASVSRSPAELIAIKPIVEINMVDPRFTETRDVLSNLDQRMNLMELAPSEFEMLITTLFAKMGLETRQTQASRGGGVDCVAYDLRPIFGGKVVIQARRYKNTVGVSAVRDLFGTLQNQGANRGVLITTSGYGKDSHEFARGKPIELIDGSGLLYLLAEHAGIIAKIEAPTEWVEQSNTYDNAD